MDPQTEGLNDANASIEWNASMTGVIRLLDGNKRPLSVYFILLFAMISSGVDLRISEDPLLTMDYIA